ncbi:MAG: aminotransferase class I/II-fold pyridoxal phosphate-dependent enzyme, partial [Planctomycetaceae bacterium]|nr:aminotransferase class I/II-fold pyridoxal phosphate-dependent enzyme [Planctomycetaceae bacterium]
MAFAPSDRLKKLPPYLFAEFERKRAVLEKQGKDIVNLGIGDPDQAPPRLLLDTMTKHLNDEYIHQYSSSQGTEEFRGAVAGFMKKRYGIALENKEICMGIGSKELIAHMPLALTNPGDVVLCPEPGYPPYRSGTIFALAEPYVMPLSKKNGFLPDLDAIPADVAKRAKILYVNYPNNPTGATAGLDFYKKCVEFAKKWGCIVVSDEAYAELYY